MKKVLLIGLVLMLALGANASTSADNASAAGDYQLVWNMDFTGASLNSDAFNIEVNGDGGGNNELQYYCEKGVSLGVEPVTGKHCLILTATKENYLGKTCTSGRVNTLGKVFFTYGKVEARIRFPQTANGLWPAFWMMGNNYSEVGWPRCGELDIIELGHRDGIKAGTQDRYFNGAMHVGSRWDAVWSDAKSVTYDYSVEDGFHTVSCEWTPTSVEMFVDKDIYPDAKPYFSTKLEPDDNDDYNRQLIWSRPNFIIFNLAIGGNFPGIWDINGITALAGGPRKMYVDYLRIYQRGDVGETFQSKVASEPIEDATGIATPYSPLKEGNVRKVLRNGEIHILYNGSEYNLLGEKINE